MFRRRCRCLVLTPSSSPPWINQPIHQTTANKVPYIVTHDGRTIRYPDPLIKVGWWGAIYVIRLVD